ncbi:SDR family oxidoreductase [Blastococcus jejuensis]|uniref:SDR family oxidoreductase n=1 Tax=Blastococcus jejuensis TaxID=351224 RepID=UPI0031D75D7E
MRRRDGQPQPTAAGRRSCPPHRRLATPEQPAAAITWLASDDASNVNGVVLPSDGGWSAL